MKNYKKICSFIITIVGFVTVTLLSCNKSMAPSKEDPTILAFVVNNGGPPSPQQSLCLANVSLINSCIGGSHRGDGLSGAICSSNVSEAEQTLGLLLSTPAASTCISSIINETACNISTNNVVNVNEAFAEDGPFGGLLECIATAIAEEEPILEDSNIPE